MSSPSVLSVAARYAIGGGIISVFLHSLLTGGKFLAVVWLYGAVMAPLTLAFAVGPSILSAPGAMLAHRMDLGWRMTSAIVSAAVLTLTLILWLNGDHMQGEQLLFVPLAAIAAIPACLADWGASRHNRLRHMPAWLCAAFIIGLAAGVLLIVSGTIATLKNPPQLTWP